MTAVDLFRFWKLDYKDGLDNSGKDMEGTTYMVTTYRMAKMNDNPPLYVDDVKYKRGKCPYMFHLYSFLMSVTYRALSTLVPLRLSSVPVPLHCNT